MLYNLDWFDARDLALAGYQVRRSSWSAGWIQSFRGLWWFRPDATTVRVALASDFGKNEFLAHDWTTAGYGGDVCSAHLAPSDSDLSTLKAARAAAPAWALRNFGQDGQTPPPPEFIPPS